MMYALIQVIVRTGEKVFVRFFDSYDQADQYAEMYRMTYIVREVDVMD